MANWFGDLQLAYKYAIVFGSLLVLTILAGICKVLYDRRKLKKFTAQQNVETGPREDQVELNTREKDEGDLFGIRAIEAGFYAGIPQSRPTSRAGSYVDSPSMSTNTLVASHLNSPKIQTNSMASSVTSLPLAHTQERSRDSETLPSSPPRRITPPAQRLAPSEAELNGRINHAASVNMDLNVPPSPVLAKAPLSPRFRDSDSDSDGQISPPTLSPRASSYKPEHYAPAPPQIPMPDALRVSDDTPQTMLPSMPQRVVRDDELHTSFPAYTEPQRRAGPSNPIEPQEPTSPIRLQPLVYQPNHQRDMSDASSVYSDKRMSTFQQRRPGSSGSALSYNYSFPENSQRNSLVLPANQDESRLPSAANSLRAPGSSASNQTNDSRFSEFYDAYYRNSQVGTVQKVDGPKRPTMVNVNAQPTIVEVPSPLPSPNPKASGSQPGVAL